MFLESKREEILEAYEKLAREFPLIFKKGEEVIERSSPNEAMALRYFTRQCPSATWKIMTWRLF